MSDERADAESRSLLEELWATPVGRRWVLKAGLGSALAGASWLYGGSRVAGAAQRAVKGASATDLQFALGSAHGVSDLVLVANGTRSPLATHTAASRGSLKATGGLWNAIDLQALTHFVSDVPLPTERGLLLSVHGRRAGRDVVICQLWHAPRQATISLAETAHRLTGSLGHVIAPPHRLKALGLTVSEIRSPAQVAELDTIGDTYQTATAMTMCHPNVATIDPTAVAATKSLLAATPPVQTLGSYIAQMQRGGKDFATLVTATDADGSPSQITLGNTTTTFSTIRLNGDDAGFVRATKASVAAGVVAVRDEAKLGAVIDKPLDQDPAASTKTWVQPQGVIPRARSYSRSRKGAGVDITVKNTGFYFGTRTEVDGSYANGKLPLKLYNNFVRWAWVYVQYVGKDGKNLSLNPNAKFPDTKYSQSLGLLPQVFTVLGVPLWDTNTIDVTLDFPEGAHSARLLYCGLGADVLGGGWRQYFPADAYPGRIAPTDEVLFPALVTGILTIGLNVFALATDLEIASAWAPIRQDIVQNLYSSGEAFAALLTRTAALSASEALAVATAAGGETYEVLEANHADTGNLWSILLAVASVIPKLLFNPKAGKFFFDIGRKLVALETEDKLAEAIPFLGEAIAIISAVGDVATLAEVCTETILSPWVIENEVSLTYPAAVTISRDPRSSTFPVTARSWRLEALIDGALSLDPITGTINDGGKTRSDPLALNVTAPFGGRHIQWSVVILDDAGRQVATGVSEEQVNDNPDHPPSTVSLAITQLPATITAATVFKRAATTTYSTAAGGYTWSDAVTVEGTVTTPGIPEVTGAAVATLAGVAGMVFKQGGHYYLRGTPLGQNDATIKLGTATTEGYTRRPFLLLDSFVDKSDEGNHVLVEPDDSTDAYHVRKVSLDPKTGQLTWDPKLSYGTFTLPVSAAALHSSGRVVAVHTDSGRLARLQPASTPRPLLAAYSAGPGTQIGLLSSPIALAITNPGVILVLEAGSPRLSAFDLNANPIAYFGNNGQYTLPLVSSGTYLDLAVDGAAQIYVLYHTGDGSQPSDYHVDVYTASGDALDTHSPGVNVPRLAVDYWRSVYGANYSPLTTLGSATSRIDPAFGVAEPSLSRFDPTAPALARPLGDRLHQLGRRSARARPG